MLEILDAQANDIEVRTFVGYTSPGSVYDMLEIQFKVLAGMSQRKSH